MTSRGPFRHHLLMKGLDCRTFTPSRLTDVFPGGRPRNANILRELVVTDLALLLHMNGMSVRTDAGIGTRGLHGAKRQRAEPAGGPALVDKIEQLLLVGI